MVSGWDLFKDYAGRQLPANVPNIFAFLSASHRVLVRESIRLVATEESLHQTHLPVPVRAVQFVKRVAMLYCVAVFPRDWIDIPNLDTLVQNERIDFGATQWHEVRAFEAYWRGFVQSLSTEKNQLAFFYSVFPHHPYMVGPDGGLIMIHPTLRPAGEGQEAIPARSRLRYHAASRSGSGETIVNLRRSLINQVRYTDHVLGELLKAIERKGLYDEALIIVMSDHGIGFTDSAQGRDNLSSRSPRHQLDSNMMNAADVLIIKYPHQQSGNIDRRHAKPYDVAPTILDVLGVDEPWKMDGVSLLVEGWPERKILFRPRNYRAPDMPMTELPEPENHHLAFQPFEPIESPWIGKATELLKLRQERSGALSYIAFETAFPWERGAEKVLVLSGFSVLDQEKRIPHQTYIAVNGTIAKAIRPSQYVKLPKHPKLTQAAWSATIPPSHLRVGKNIIRAFSPVDARETAFVEFRRPFIFQITQDRLNKLRLSVAKKRD